MFFREVPARAAGSIDAAIDGPLGSLGVPLLAERAIAVDARAIPLGAPVFLATTLPLSARRLERLTLAQDTGGAIRGAVRADYFWGFGDERGARGGPHAAGRPHVAPVAARRCRCPDPRHAVRDPRASAAIPRFQTAGNGAHCTSRDGAVPHPTTETPP